jgi:hypothetical protein
MIEYSLFIFIFHICAKFQTQKKRKKTHHDMCILKIVHDCFSMMGALTIFGKGGFIFSFVSYGLVTKSLEAGCTFEEVAEKIKCQKMNVNFFYNQSRMNPLT